MLAQNENVGTPPEKRDMVEGCLSIGFVFEQDANGAFRFSGGYPVLLVVVC